MYQRFLNHSAQLLLAGLPLVVAFAVPLRTWFNDPDGLLLTRQEASQTLKHLALAWGYGWGIIVLLALGVMAGRSTKHDELAQSSRPSLSLTVLLALLGWATLSLLFSGWPSLSWRQADTFFFPALLACAVLWLRPVISAERITICIALGGFVMALIVLAQSLGMNPLAFAYKTALQREDARTGVYGTLGNPEFVGGYLAVTALLSLALGLWFMMERNRFTTLTGCLISAGLLQLLALTATGTRSALLAFIAGTVVTLFRLQRWMSQRSRNATGTSKKVSIVSSVYRPKFIWGSLLIALLTCLLIFSTNNPLNRRLVNLTSRLTQLSNLQSPSVSERILFWVAGMELIKENPLLGVGPGLFPNKFHDGVALFQERAPQQGIRQLLGRTSGSGAGEAHNDYLQMAVELGLPGLLLFLGVLALGLAPPGWMTNTGKNSATSEVAGASFLLVLQGGLLVFCMLAAASFPLQTPARASLFWLLITLILLQSQANGEKSAVSPSP
jgi:O-antigen ligase